MALNKGDVIDNADILFQSITEDTKIDDGQLNNNYYNVSQVEGDIIRTPTLKSYTITKSPGTGGSISGSDSYTVSTSSQSFRYTASANSGYIFKSWSTSKGTLSGTTSNPTTLTLDSKEYGNVTLSSIFAALPSSLTIGGSWRNTQYIEHNIDAAGLTFTVTYYDGSTATKTASQISISPTRWGNTVGTQTATFSYTENGTTVSATKTATVYVIINQFYVGTEFTSWVYS